MKHLVWAALAALPLLTGSLRAEDPQQADASLAKSAANDLLIARNSMEALTTAATVSLDAGLTLNLEPGVRVTRDDDGYLFAARGAKKIEFETDGDRLALTSPVRAQRTPEGWVINGKVLRTSAITARRSTQDDADSNLKAMQESAKKLKARNEALPPKAKPQSKARRLYGDNPFPSAEPFNAAAIQQLTHLSPVGF